MNVSFTPEIEKIISGKVKTGLYTSASEVLTKSLLFFVGREKEATEEEILKGMIQKGLNSPLEPLGTAEEIIKIARARRNKAS